MSGYVRTQHASRTEIDRSGQLTRTATKSPPQLALRSKLAAHITVHPPREPGQRWVIEQRGSRYFRVGTDIAVLAQFLTGEYDHSELLALLDERWTAEALEETLLHFASLKLLDDGSPARSSNRRVTLVLPLTVQFNLFNPTEFLTSLLPLIRILGRWPSLAFIGALGIGGIVAMLLQLEEVGRAISQPLPGVILAWMLFGVFVSTTIHELCHAAVLVYYGGTAHRMGIMLFYLVPAFFCDVSDGWLLPEKRQRVRIALAGIVAQAACAGTAAFVAFSATGISQVALLLTAASLYFACIINLVPFVKLDGYLALMSALDISDLRTLAISDARGFLARALFNAHPPRRLPDRWWVVPYGVICIAFPIYLIGGVAFAMWTRALANTGGATALLTLLFLLVLIIYVCRELLQVWRTARAAGVSIARMSLVTTVAAIIISVALSVVTVDDSVEGSFVRYENKTVLAVADNGTKDLIADGQEVDLRSNGVILRPSIGSGTIASSESTVQSFSSAEFMPYEIPVELTEDYRVFTMSMTEDPGAESGNAQVQLGRHSVWEWLFNRFIRPVI